MKQLFCILIFALGFIVSQAQNADRRVFLSEENFVPSCIQGALQQMGQSAQTYCTCAYEKIINDLSDEEFEKAYTLISKGKSSFIELPGVKSIIASCIDEAAKEEVQNQSPEEENKLRDIYVKSCADEVKKNKSLKKSINAAAYCECTWYKIVDGVGMDKLISNSKSKEVSDAIQQYATECLTEQFK